MTLPDMRDAAALAQDRFPYTCPVCGATSAGWRPYDDALAGYCGRCHDYTSPPPVYEVAGWTAGRDDPSQRFGYTCVCPAVWRGPTPDAVRLALVGHRCPVPVEVARWSDDVASAWHRALGGVGGATGAGRP